MPSASDAAIVTETASAVGVALLSLALLPYPFIFIGR
jgi:hypothetical protein